MINNDILAYLEYLEVRGSFPADAATIGDIGASIGLSAARAREVHQEALQQELVLRPDDTFGRTNEEFVVTLSDRGRQILEDTRRKRQRRHAPENRPVTGRRWWKPWTWFS